jgi:fatty-acyl-CoA synthase
MEFNLGTVHDAICGAIPDREAIVHGERRVTYGEIGTRTRRLAAALSGLGLGCKTERSELAGHASGQDHLALYMYNCPEYLESMLGAYKARVAPFNVNYRYVDEELVYLLRDSRARGMVFHAAFAETVARIRADLPELEFFVQVNDGSGREPLEGALAYESLIESAADAPTGIEPSPDDLYVLYTGGTTGMPKGVLWRQADVFVTALGGQTRAQSGEEFESMDAVVERAVRGKGAMRALPSPPFMHGAAHWSAFHTFHMGGTVIIQNEVSGLVASDIWSTVERESAESLLIVGDAFGRPLLDELDRHAYDLSSLKLLVSGGAALTASLKQQFIARIPGLTILDSVGSSETGGQAQHLSSEGRGVSTGTFSSTPGNVVVSEDLSRVLAPGSVEMGWLARRGRVPLGYLGDEEKTARTFPRIEGERFSVPGDRARMREDGVVELYGRDSVTINSGGEKIFAEEVEQALRHHEGVYDAVVAGRPSERWGNEVVAVVRLREGIDVAEDSLLSECAKHIARYKLPKKFVFVDEIVRSPSGKADYRWARETIAAHTETRRPSKS